MLNIMKLLQAMSLLPKNCLKIFKNQYNFESKPQFSFTTSSQLHLNIKTLNLNHNLAKYITQSSKVKFLKSQFNLNYFNINTLKYSTDSDSDSEANFSNEIDDDLIDIIQEQHISVKDVLFPNSQDPFIIKLNNCASLSEVFSLFQVEDLNTINHEHLAQTCLVLWDLQKLFYQVNVVNNWNNLELNRFIEISRDYLGALQEHKTCEVFFKLILKAIDEFDMESLSCMLLYLNKMGLPMNHEVLSAISYEIKKKFEESFSLSAMSRFLIVLSSEISLGMFFAVEDVVPKIFEEIDRVLNGEDFKLLTICLNCLQPIVTDDTLLKYKNKLKSLLHDGLISTDDHRTILKVVIFLSVPSWRDKNMEMINEVIALLNNNLHKLHLNDLLSLHDIFYKNQEPAYILTELQRCTTRHLIKLEENSSPLMDIRLKLLQSVVSFSSPMNRSQYNKMIQKYLKYPLSGTCLLELYKLLLFAKITDEKMSKQFWDNMLKVLNQDELFRSTYFLRVCSNYVTFHHDLNQFRSLEFEHKINSYIQEELQNGTLSLTLSNFTTLASFAIVFSDDENLLEIITTKIEENYKQLNEIEIFNLSKSLQMYHALRKDLKKNNLYHDRIKKVVEDYLGHKLTGKMLQQDYNTLNLNIKSAILLETPRDMKIAERFCELYKIIKPEDFSSKIVKNVTFCLYATGVLLPDIVDRIVDYVITFKDNILGYNAEKVIYLCLYLGYMPKNSEEFFKAMIEIILRDQERLSGLAYLQACLSLCFFHKLPESFIKQIFNVSFLEKLDAELSNCYYKDRYPVRVRHRMMQLNRAVCLDYPEANVPWFHQKYVADSKYKYQKETEDYKFTQNVRVYLSEILGGESYLQVNQITPYGYFIDFVINQDSSGKILERNSQDVVSKKAILLMRPGSYTKIHEQLKGQHQLKIRHLEILGYEIIPVNHLDWRYLTTGEEKMKFLRDRIWPKIDQTNSVDLG